MKITITALVITVLVLAGTVLHKRNIIDQLRADLKSSQNEISKAKHAAQEEKEKNLGQRKMFRESLLAALKGDGKIQAWGQSVAVVPKHATRLSISPGAVVLTQDGSIFRQNQDYDRIQ